MNTNNNINAVIQMTPYGAFLDVHVNGKRMARMNVSSLTLKQREHIQSGVVKLTKNILDGETK